MGLPQRAGGPQRAELAIAPALEQLAALAVENAGSGTVDVIEPTDGVIGIGSGGPYALAAAKALIAHSGLDAAKIALEAMKIAAGICIYTNEHINVHELSSKETA